jgi:hypothetical protein
VPCIAADIKFDFAGGQKIAEFNLFEALDTRPLDNLRAPSHGRNPHHFKLDEN